MSLNKYFKIERIFSSKDVRQANSKSNALVVYQGKVIDISAFIDSHPGGENIVKFMGEDITQVFSVKHSADAKELLSTFVVGRVVCFIQLVYDIIYNNTPINPTGGRIRTGHKTESQQFNSGGGCSATVFIVLPTGL